MCVVCARVADASTWLAAGAWLAALGASVLVLVGAACAMHGYMAHCAFQLVTFTADAGGFGLWVRLRRLAWCAAE